MRILIIGAYGLLGGYVTARLLRDGHSVVGAGRDITAAARRFPQAVWIRADLQSMATDDWAPHLASVDAVVNCAGALQDSPRDKLQAVHVAGIEVLVRACVAAGVGRFVQISALGVETAPGAFGRTKQAADEVIRASGLDWVVLRPGLVLAPAAFGGSALLRGLAGFPGVIPAVHAGSAIRTVSIDDISEAVSRAVHAETPGRFTCDLAAAEPVTLRDILVALRGWLGFAPAPVAALPEGFGRIAALFADGLAYLGWRSPMRSAALQQLAGGVVGSASDAAAHLGFTPRCLADTLAAWPSGVQERWFARLYFLKPLALTFLAVFWTASGLIGLAQRDDAVTILSDAGMAAPLADILVLGGSLVDMLLGLLACARRTARPALIGMIALTCAYLVGTSMWIPALWIDPLGPTLKSIVAAVAALFVLAVLDER